MTKTKEGVWCSWCGVVCGAKPFLKRSGQLQTSRCLALDSTSSTSSPRQKKKQMRARICFEKEETRFGNSELQIVNQSADHHPLELQRGARTVAQRMWSGETTCATGRVEQVCSQFVTVSKSLECVRKLRAGWPLPRTTSVSPRMWLFPFQLAAGASFVGAASPTLLTGLLGCCCTADCYAAGFRSLRHTKRTQQSTALCGQFRGSTHLVFLLRVVTGLPTRGCVRISKAAQGTKRGEIRHTREGNMRRTGLPRCDT